ncbi:DUF4838 domain-containing protein [Candidatus Sumerlaeota bacterium]|nr:DUF4838 domain-containing protein [Candidatus Sumerlaeota bacterium]
MNASQKMILLFKNGKTHWKIRVPVDAGDIEKFACEEICKYIHKITGTTLSYADENENDLIIYIGLRKDTRFINDLPAPAEGFDGYSILVSNRIIAILGENPRGVLYGVYDFLEKLGCRWYHPNLDPLDPELIHQKQNLDLPEGAWSEAAKIKDRIYWVSGFAFEIIPERLIPQIDWAAKNRFNCLSWQCVFDRIESDLELMNDKGIFEAMEKRGLNLHGPGHAFPYFLPASKYFKDHPEWYGYRDGNRQSRDTVFPAVTFCLSNPEACEQFMKNVEMFVKKYPQIKRLDILPADGAVACECEKCRESGSSDLIIALFNKLIARIERINPEITVDVVPGYGLLEKTPVKITPNDKLIGVYAHWGRNHKTSYNDADYERRSNLLVWKSCFREFWICSYYAANSHQPFFGPPFIHALKYDTEFYLEQGVSGAFVLEFPFGLWWNNAFNVRMGGIYPYYHPKRDPVSEIRDYAVHYFGEKAASLIAEFFLMLGDNRNLDKCYRASRGEADEGDMKFLKELSGMLKRCLQIASDDAVYSYRVQKLNACFDFLIFFAPSRREIMEIAKTAEEGVKDESGKRELNDKIASAQKTIEEILQKSAELEKQYPGVMDAEWMKSWMIHRTYISPLDKVEKSIGE